MAEKTMTLQEEAEWKTRQARIDPRLKAQDWQIVSADATIPLTSRREHAVKEYPTDNGPADYALCHNGTILGIVEAKKLTLGPQNVLTQAERYSRGATDSSLNFRGFRVPFLYATSMKLLYLYRPARNKPKSCGRLNG